MHSRARAVGRTQQTATDDAIAWSPGGDGLRRWENQRMLSSSTAFSHDTAQYVDACVHCVAGLTVMFTAVTIGSYS